MSNETAPDPTAVEALADLLERHPAYSTGSDQADRFRAREAAGAILAAIARGEVPGVTLSAQQSGIPREAVEALREWREGGLYRAALLHAIECYAGPDDDTLPVLRLWLDRAVAITAHPATDQPGVRDA